MILLDDCKEIIYYGGGKDLTYDDLYRLECILGPETSRSIFEYDDMWEEINAGIHENKESTITQK